MSDSDSLLDSDSDDDNHYDDALEPIHRAAMAGDLVMLRRELKAGVSPNRVVVYQDHGLTPLMILCANMTNWGNDYSIHDDIRLEGVRLLLAAGALPDGVEGLPYESSLCNACFMGNQALVKLLIAAGADVSWSDNDGWTALHATAACGTSGSATCAVALLEAGAAVDAEQREGHSNDLVTPLMIDTWDGSHSRVSPVLLRYGADLDRALTDREENRQRVNKLYFERVHAAGGWKRYAQAHTARLAPIFAKVFPHARLPPELVSHIVGLWAHVGYY